MAIQTNLTNLTPRRERYKKEITLVSSGYYNQKAFPGGKVTVYPWDSAIDAWFQNRLRQPKKEYALWEVVEHVAALNGASYKEMPVGDIMTIVMVSRAIRSGLTIEFTAKCPSCEHKLKDTISVPDELVKIGEKAPNYPGFENFKLPEVGDEVQMRVLTVNDEILIMERSDEDRKVMPDAEALVLIPIITIGGGKPDSLQELLTWYRALSPKDAEELAKKRALMSPQLDSDVPIECDKCHHKYAHTLDLQQDFFRVS